MPWQGVTIYFIFHLSNEPQLRYYTLRVFLYLYGVRAGEGGDWVVCIGLRVVTLSDLASVTVLILILLVLTFTP